MSLPADQPASSDLGVNFEERFSPDARAQPIFTRPDIQEMLAMLPPEAAPAETLVAGAEPEAAVPPADQQASASAEPQPAENTASVTPQEPDLAAPAHPPEEPSPEPASPSVISSAPAPEVQPPGLPPPPPPADVVLPPAQDLATAESPHRAAPQAPREMSGASRPEAARQTETSKPPTPHARAGKSPGPKRQAERKASHAKKQATAPNQPAVTGSVSACPTGVDCPSQRQTFSILLGFIAGGLVGGPFGALAGGTLGAAMTAPGSPQGTSSAPAQRR
jgi:hypothetical protein